MYRLQLTALAAVVLFGAGPAHADLRFCNNSNTTIYTALGYNNNDQWEAEGWWEIFPGDCTTVVSGSLQNRYYYGRGEGDDGRVWEGNDDFYFCTQQTRFVMVDRENCQSNTVDRKRFFQIDTGNSSDHNHNFDP